MDGVGFNFIRVLETDGMELALGENISKRYRSRSSIEIQLPVYPFLASFSSVTFVSHSSIGRARRLAGVAVRAMEHSEGVNQAQLASALALT